MADEKQQREEAPETPGATHTLNVSYAFAPGYRTIHVDGAHGGITPHGRTIAVSFYNEKRPMPPDEKLVLRADGGLQRPALAPTDGSNVLREVEMCAIFDLFSAKALSVWLAARVAEMETLWSSGDEQ